ACVRVPGPLRDAGCRCIPDSPPRLEALARACAAVEIPAADVSADALVAALARHPAGGPGPEHLVLEIAPTEARRLFGVAGSRLGENVVQAAIRQWSALRPDGALTLALGGSDPDAHALL